MSSTGRCANDYARKMPETNSSKAAYRSIFRGLRRFALKRPLPPRTPTGTVFDRSYIADWTTRLFIPAGQTGDKTYATVTADFWIKQRSISKEESEEELKKKEAKLRPWMPPRRLPNGIKAGFIQSPPNR